MTDEHHAHGKLARVVGIVAAGVACAALVFLLVIGLRQRADYQRELDQPLVAPKIDPSLIRWREVERIDTGLRGARGIAVGADGGLYLAGGGTVYRRRGERMQSLFPPGSSPVTCVAVAEGRVLIGMRDHIEALSSDGTRARWRAANSRSYLTSLAAAGDDVWAADAGKRIVYHYNRAGKLLGRLGQKDPARGVPGLVAPSPYLDVAVTHNVTVWVANPGRHRLEKYAPDGRPGVAWGKAGMAVEKFCGCCNPVNFALLPDGRFVTAEKGLRRVKIYRADGTFESVVAGPESFGGSTGALDVATDARGRVYVLDSADGVVRVFAPK